MRYFLGMDVGGTRLRLGAVDETGGQLCAPMKVISSECLAGDEEPAEVLEKVIRAYLKENGLDPGGLSAAGIGMPASVSKDLSTVCEVPNIPNRRLNGLPLGKQMTERMQVPVLVDKDVNLLLRCDMLQNGLTGITAGVYIGTGIGTAVSIDDRILYGTNGFAMDCGHVTVPGAAGICGCGKTGCAETIGSGRILRELGGREFPDTPVGELFAAHAGTKALQEYMKACAFVPAMLCTVFDHCTLILSGGVVEMDGFPRDMMEKEILRQAGRAVAGAGFRFVYPAKNSARGIIGAALLAREKGMI